MAENKAKTTETKLPKSPKFNFQALEKMGTFKGYQRHFAKVILGKGEYTIEEALSKLDKSGFFKKGGKA